MRNVLEKKLRAEGKKFLQGKGYLVLPLNDFRSRGYPDDMIIKGGVVSFIEWKRPKGGVVSPHQAKILASLNGQGVRCAVCSSIESLKFFIEDLENEKS